MRKEREENKRKCTKERAQNMKNQNNYNTLKQFYQIGKFEPL